VLDNPEVVYAPATPFDLANALCALVERPETERCAAAQKAAASVQGASWEDAGTVLARVIRDVVDEAASETPAPA